MLEKIVRMERKRISALESYDAVKYFELCNELGIKPEAKDLYEIGAAENIFQEKSREKFKKNKFKKYEEFLGEVNFCRLNPYDIFSATNVKMRILKNVMNYKNLWTKYGKIPINECSDAMVGSVFKRVYEISTKKTF